jgi:Na+-driven multidrug efflux pump
VQGNVTLLLIFAIASLLVGLVLVFGAVPLAAFAQHKAENLNSSPAIFRIVGVFFILLAILGVDLIVGHAK